ncbi:MAG: CoA transferase, partial [Dehalococcoidia bacterium]
MGSLSGDKVLEFGGMLAGAVTTKHLALMGAEVIKVESSKRMDITRVQHPGAHAALIDAAPTDTFMTNETNLNKLDVTLNLSHPEGVQLARRLVAISDVLVENFRPGVMDRIGLGYQALKEMKSDLVMLSISMAGGTGREAHYTGYAPIFSALGGVGHL